MLDEATTAEILLINCLHTHRVDNLASARTRVHGHRYFELFRHPAWQAADVPLSGRLVIGTRGRGIRIVRESGLQLVLECEPRRVARAIVAYGDREDNRLIFDGCVIVHMQNSRWGRGDTTVALSVIDPGLTALVCLRPFCRN